MELPSLKMFPHCTGVVVAAVVMTVVARHRADLFISTETNAQKCKKNPTFQNFYSDTF